MLTGLHGCGVAHFQLCANTPLYFRVDFLIFFCPTPNIKYIYLLVDRCVEREKTRVVYSVQLVAQFFASRIHRASSLFLHRARNVCGSVDIILWCLVSIVLTFIILIASVIITDRKCINLPPEITSRDRYVGTLTRRQLIYTILTQHIWGLRKTTTIIISPLTKATTQHSRDRRGWHRQQDAQYRFALAPRIETNC